MKIGIVIYSQTGNTRSVAEILEGALRTAGHDVEIVNIEAVVTKKEPQHPTILEAPKLEAYDFIIVGSPVHGFNLAVPTRVYLNQVSPLDEKKFICFATQSLPFKWLGGERATKTMKQILTSKGGHFIGHSVINWNKSDRDERIDKMIAHIVRLIEIDNAVDL